MSDGSKISKTLWRNLGLTAEIRGRDSGGQILVRDDGSLRIQKVINNPGGLTLPLRESPERNDLFAIGHNRNTTIGKKYIFENTHPFSTDEKIYLMHNGTFTQHSKVKKKLGLNPVGDTDSEILMLYLLKYRDNLPEGMREIINDSPGSALAVYDYQHMKLHLIRGREKPLFVMNSSGGKYILYASIPEVLYIAWSYTYGVRPSSKRFKLMKPEVVQTFKLGSTLKNVGGYNPRILSERLLKASLLHVVPYYWERYLSREKIVSRPVSMSFPYEDVSFRSERFLPERKVFNDVDFDVIEENDFNTE